MSNQPRHRSPRLSLAVAAFLLAACRDSGLQPIDVPLSEATPFVAPAAGRDAAALAVAVGRKVFFDKSLSLRGNQACASCHDPDFGFTSPVVVTNGLGAVQAGSVPTRFGNRRPPTAAYASFSPTFHYDADGDVFVGGNFWDGRATGERLGAPTADQATGPFTNPVEMALPDAACVTYKVATSSYATLFTSAFGSEIMQIAWPSGAARKCATEGVTLALSPVDRARAQRAFEQVAGAISAFEGSPEVNAFSSSFDRFRNGRGQLSSLEREGLVLFEGKAGCAGCHPSDGRQALFTDFTYDNIGTPANAFNPAFLSTGFVDGGLGTQLGRSDLLGAMKVPTLRNLDKRPTPLSAKSYMHNGVFKTLEQVVHFYNTRDVLPTCKGAVTPYDPRFGRTCWPAAETLANVNVDELGNFGLTSGEERAVVAFLRTLSDR